MLFRSLKEIELDVGTRSVKVRDIPRLFTIAIHGENTDWAHYMESGDLDDGQDQRSIRMTENLHLCHLIDAVNNGDLTVHSYMTLLPITRPSDPILRKEVWKKYRDNVDDYFLDCIVTIDELIKYAERYLISVSLGKSEDAKLIATIDDSIDTRKKWEIQDTMEYKCRQIANEYIDKKKPIPSVENIAKYVAQKLMDENIVGKRGDYWDWQTIKKEALIGITGRKAKGKK